jgi:hypothetical protein
VIFLSPKTKSVLQPKLQGVIALFKAYYISKTFTKLAEEEYGQHRQIEWGTGGRISI